ncbi:MAG: alpha/beta fold hydrolase [Gaiellales bacterium]
MAAAPAARTQLRATADDGVELLGMVSAGTGPGVLLLHGLASNARMWDGVVGVLEAQGRAAAAFDLRGHGRSQQADDGYSIDGFARDAATVLRALAEHDPVWARPIVAGQSLGGNVVLALAALDVPLAGIVLVDGGFIDLSARYDDWDACAAALAPPDLSHLTPAELESLLRNEHPDWSDAAIAGMAACWDEVDGHVAPHLTRPHHMALLQSLYEHPPRLDAGRVTAPTTIIASAGAESDPIKRATVERLADALARCRVVWRSDADHDIHAQHPDETAALILAADA